MNKLMRVAAIAAVVALMPVAAQATPEEDLQAFRDYYKEKFPDVPVEDYVNGAYALDPIARENWLSIEEFPPYGPAIDEGETLFHTPFKNGKTYADCFPGYKKGIRQNYPYFDDKTGQVKTLELEINECRVNNGEEPLKYNKGHIASLSAYLAYLSRGNIFDIKVPNDPRAQAAYEAGRKFYFTKRGQLNLACADCHIYSVGKNLRTELLSMSVGHVTHFPKYRSKWGEMGTLNRRFKGCNEQVRAKAFSPQSEEYRNLEYFLTYISNGLPVNGPGARK